MKKLHGEDPHPELRSLLRIDCARCCGLCCVALYCFRTDGFPADKPAGEPCRYLQQDFRCRIHPDLAERGMRGCLAFDCLGAGQKVTRALCAGESWRDHPELFEVFHAVCRLHQMLWYLSEAVTLLPAEDLRPRLEEALREVASLAERPPQEMLALELESIRDRVNPLLKEAAERTMEAAGGRRGGRQRSDLIGKRFRGGHLVGADLSLALLIAADLSGCDLAGANLLGADLRDANLGGADLRESLFLTQAQLNGARGDAETRLPPRLERPRGWCGG